MEKPSPLNCREAFERLDDFLDRELTPEEAAEVEKHIAVCAHCARDYTFEAAVLDGLKRRLRRITAPPELLQRILGSLERASGDDRK